MCVDIYIYTTVCIVDIYIYIVGIYQHISHIWETSWNTEATTFSGERVSACTAVWGRPGLEKCSEGNHPVLCVHDMLKYIIYIDVCVLCVHRFQHRTT